VAPECVLGIVTKSIEHRAEFRRRHIVVNVGRLDFLVANSGDFGEHALEVRRHLIANCIELEAYPVFEVPGPGLRRYRPIYPSRVRRRGTQRRL
jgi:hypothetical protein